MILPTAAMYWSDWWPGQIWWATTALLISRLAISVESGLLAQKVMCCHGLLFTFEYQCNNCKRSLVNTNSSLLTLTWALIMLSWIIQAVQLILLNELTSKHHVCLLAIWWNMDFRSCKILSADFLCELLNTTYATFFWQSTQEKKFSYQYCSLILPDCLLLHFPIFHYISIISIILNISPPSHLDYFYHR